MLTIFLSLLTAFFVDLTFAAPTTETEPKKSIWSISIFKGPAPSPEEGPPASASALRDPSKLKFELVGIFCAYIAWIAATTVAVLLVRRRYRQSQERAEQAVRLEMFKPSGAVTLREIETGPKSPQYPLSPRSPGKMSSIRSWARREKGAGQSVTSLSTVNTKIDERVLDNDRVKNMDDMAKLYAAVMLHDEEQAATKARSSAGSSPVEQDITPVTPRSPVPPQLAHPAYIPPTPSHYSQAYQQEYEQDSYPQYMHPQHNSPPESHGYMPPPPPPAMDNDRQSLLEDRPQTHRKGKPSAISIVSTATSRLGSSHSSKARPSPITVRGQAISKPLGSATFSGSQASLESRVYSPGPPPPTPGRGYGLPPTPRHAPPTVIEEIEMHGRPELVSPPLPTEDSTINTTSKALPFRQFYQESPMKSAPATKTTFLDRRASAFNGPKTGVPRTPYSPYCPTTPMTPITPRRLPGKEELKKNKKQYALKVVKENEMVQSDTDMWGTD